MWVMRDFARQRIIVLINPKEIKDLIKFLKSSVNSIFFETESFYNLLIKKYEDTKKLRDK